ncbi:tyrosine-type recombinase/integrase [Pseudomonas sp. S31]|uniref:tyrosine-type recombinase/integrase n=1 Tax=Pseudomonas sp. S31 TaxID=1564473 RepID=UPI001912CD40|nr:tyrosine-type recombinase/integrase [Pseudomonas sp. S31]MBK4998607.1 tyrosine-type recombinase/integrase [Pseudomonas sp. S31]
MKVMMVRGRELDLSNSILANGKHREQFLAQPEGSEPLVQVTGCGLIDDDEQLLPLVSSYLCRNYRNILKADKTVLSYARRISYLLQDQKTQPEYENSPRDDLLLSVGLGNIEVYLGRLDGAGLAPKTVQGRDAAYHHFFTSHLCISLSGKPPLRADNPYEHGPIRTGKANIKAIVQPCSMPELEQLILHAQSERERCMLQLIYDSGVRESEVPRITLQHIRDALDYQKLQYVSADCNIPVNADYSPLHVQGSKGRKNQIVPRVTLVSRTTLERIERYHSTPLYRRYSQRFRDPNKTPAFFNSHGKAYTTKSVEKLFERVSERARKSRKIKRKISPHKFRHGSAYLLLTSPDLGTDYFQRLGMLSIGHGHAYMTTTEGYAQIPHDIYQKLCKPDSLLKTKCGEMQVLRDRTTRRIKTGDKK